MSKMSEIDAEAQLMILALQEQNPGASRQQLAEISYVNWASAPSSSDSEKRWA